MQVNLRNWPSDPVPQEALQHQFCVIEFSVRCGWMVLPCGTRHEAVTYYDRIAPFRPAAALTHGMFMADNELREYAA